MKTIFSLFFSLLLILTVSACDREKVGSEGQVPQASVSGENGETATKKTKRMVLPSFSLTSVVDGSPINREDFADKVLLVAFFATWCPPCVQEMPTLVELQNEFGPKGFSVLGFSVDEGGMAEESVADLAAKMNLNYPVAIVDQTMTDAFGGVYGIPATFLVDRRGDLIKRYIGYTPHDSFADDIREQLDAQ